VLWQSLARGINELHSMSVAEIEGLCLEFDAPDGKTLEVDGTTRDAYMRSRPRHHLVDTRLTALMHLREGFESACHHLDNITGFTVISEASELLIERLRLALCSR
jgi:hypothetical protein